MHAEEPQEAINSAIKKVIATQLRLHEAIRAKAELELLATEVEAAKIRATATQATVLIDNLAPKII